MMRGVVGGWGKGGGGGGLLCVYMERDTFRSRLQFCNVRPVRDGGKDSWPLLLGPDSAKKIRIRLQRKAATKAST
jgi:hypothetical protein